MNRMIFTTTMIYSVSLCGSHIQAHRSQKSNNDRRKEEPKKKLEKTSPLVRT